VAAAGSAENNSACRQVNTDMNKFVMSEFFSSHEKNASLKLFQ